MKTPAFWSDNNMRSTMLWPLAQAYEIVSTLRRAYSKSTRLPIPVICIGNLTAGGAGKTPVALHIGQLLKDKSISAFFLSRGYGGTLPGPVLVDSKKHNARDVGDEPLLLARVLPTIVAKDRVSGAQLAIAQGAKAIIMDDGFQNPSIVKTLSLLVIDGRNGFGNGRLLPAGPLRERPDVGLKRTHAVVVINPTPATPVMPPDKPVLIARTHPVAVNALKGKKLIAFCGLASPQKFFETLAQASASPVETVIFPDHYLYSAADWKKLVAKANKIQAGLVTTAKDAVRLPPSVQKQVAIVDIALTFDNPTLLDAILDYAMGNAQA